MSETTEDLTQYVKHVAYHRNGVGGHGFYVAIVTDPTEDGREFLITTFEGYGYCAVLTTEDIAKGNLSMHGEIGPDLTYVPESGGAAWRGDVFQDRWQKTIIAAYEARSEEQSDRMTALLRKQQDEREQKAKES